jgi:hypothetical protein
MVKVSSRLIGLAAGLTLVALFFLSIYGLIPLWELPVYSYLREALRLFLLGLGVAIVIYSAAGDRGCWIASAFFGVLAMVFFTFGGFVGPFASFFLISVVLAASCVAVYLPKKKAFRMAAIPLLFIFIVAFIFYGSAAVLYFTVNPFDDPRRDEINRMLGYSLCGEYTIDIIPGKRYVIEWNKTLRGDEELACYIKIRVSDPHKVAYIHFKHQSLLRPEVAGGDKPTPPGYYALAENMPSLLQLNFYKRLLEVGGKYHKQDLHPYSSALLGKSEDYMYINRWDFYIAYMPAEPIPPGFGDYASVWMELRVEIDVIHPV